MSVPPASYQGSLASLHHHGKVAASYEESCNNAKFDYYDLVRLYLQIAFASC